MEYSPQMRMDSNKTERERFLFKRFFAQHIDGGYFVVVICVIGLWCIVYIMRKQTKQTSKKSSPNEMERQKITEQVWHCD